MISRVSSTESVVCVMYASRAPAGKRERLRVGDRLDEHRRLGRLAERAFDLFVAGVADEHDRVARRRVSARLRVHLRHERARRVDRDEAARVGRTAHRRRDAVRGEDDGRALGHLLDRVDEDRAELLELADDVRVVDDLLADVDRLAVEPERPLDRVDGPLDPGAIAAGEARRTRFTKPRARIAPAA